MWRLLRKESKAKLDEYIDQHEDEVCVEYLSEYTRLPKDIVRKYLYSRGYRTLDDYGEILVNAK